MVACFDCSARFRTSCATTPKPLPCSPAFAASIEAFTASRFDCSARSLTVSMISPIACPCSLNRTMLSAMDSICSRLCFIACGCGICGRGSYLRGGSDNLLGGRRENADRLLHFSDNSLELLHHDGKSLSQDVLVGLGFNHDREIAVGNLFGHSCHLPKGIRHLCEGRGQDPDLISPAAGNHADRQVPGGDLLCRCGDFAERASDISGEEHADQTQKRERA